MQQRNPLENEMTTFRITEFRVRTDIVVVGSDPEIADASNPRGELYGFAAYVEAISPWGDIRELYVSTAHREAEALGAADQLAQRLQARLNGLGRAPVGFDSWVAGRPVYGSDAYVEYGADDDIALELKEELCF